MHKREESRAETRNGAKMKRAKSKRHSSSSPTSNEEDKSSILAEGRDSGKERNLKLVETDEKASTQSHKSNSHKDGGSFKGKIESLPESMLGWERQNGEGGLLGDNCRVKGGVFLSLWC
jgi:hypothetical protein